jgi:glutamine amidotransferase
LCRLYGLRATDPTKVECTLVYAQNAMLRQSRADLRGIDHSDGWGISCYREDLPLAERRAASAHEDVHFSTTAERVYSSTVVAHVRRATVGRVTLDNTHPFVYGHWTFAHNGTVRNIEALGPALEDETPQRFRRLRRGDTDSERAFLWILGRMRSRGQDPEARCRDHAGLADVLAGAVEELAERSAAGGENPSKLNFILTDGHVMLATRWGHSLHLLTRDGIHDCEICGIPHIHHDAGAEYRAVVLASEPISSEYWREVPDRSVVTVGPEMEVAVQRHSVGRTGSL